MNEPCLIYGAGGFGREVAWLLREGQAVGGRYIPIGFIDDDSRLHGSSLVELPIMGLRTACRIHPNACLVVAVGKPQARAVVVERAQALGFAFPTVIHPSVLSSKYVTTGEGTLLCAKTIVTTQVTIGNHTHVNLACTLGHDVTIGAYCTISPGVHISGWVHLGNRVFVGTGAVFVNGTPDSPLTVGDDAIVGAAACVTRSVASGDTVVGVPARTIMRS